MVLLTDNEGLDQTGMALVVRICHPPPPPKKKKNNQKKKNKKKPKKTTKQKQQQQKKQKKTKQKNTHIFAAHIVLREISRQNIEHNTELDRKLK